MQLHGLCVYPQKNQYRIQANLAAVLRQMIKGSIVGFDELNHTAFPGETTAVRGGAWSGQRANASQPVERRRIVFGGRIIHRNLGTRGPVPFAARHAGEFCLPGTQPTLRHSQ